MPTESAYTAARRMETDILRVLAKSPDVGEPAVRKAIKGLKLSIVDARLDVRDYDFAETRNEQLRHAANARKRLASVREHMLQLSQYNMFSAVEVAEISARLDRLMEMVD